MKIGLFVPIANNGWLISTSAPQYKPSFELNKKLVQKAEEVGMDFALAMVKLRGFGGETEFWDYAHESFTLLAGIAAVTDKIKLYATTPVLAMAPAIVARMSATIESIAPGRFGVNIVAGWAEAEYSQMGLWPGNEHFTSRYDYSSEYVQVMKDLWTTGKSDFKGEFFKMEDCRMLPMPSTPIEIVCAGQSPRGMQFCAEYGDYQFVMGTGVNTPVAHRATVEQLQAAAEKTGRDVGSYVLLMVIADETDEAAWAKFNDYKEHADVGALAWMSDQGHADTSATDQSTGHYISLPEGAFRFNMGAIVGSYESVAAMLDEAGSVPGTGGLMLVFDDFEVGLEQFGEKIQPLMKTRADLGATVS